MSSVKAPELKPYVQTYQAILKKLKIDDKDIVGVSVRFRKLEDNNLGIFYPYSNVIYINTKYWGKLTHASREQLLFHELSHVLDLQHTPSYSIMQPAGLIPDSIYIRYYSYFINELFKTMTKTRLKFTYSEVRNKEKLVTKAEVLQNEHAVIRFTATWCPPCKALAPVFDEVAAAHPDVKTYVVDVDQNPDLARDLNVRGIPTCMAIRNKAVSETLVGNQPKPELERLFK